MATGRHAILLQWVAPWHWEEPGVLMPHYSDVIMSAMVSQITGVSSVYPTVCSGTDQRIHQSSAPLVFGWEMHRWIPPHKGTVTRKMFPYDNVITKRGWRWRVKCNNQGTTENDHLSWWRHQMETFSALLAICAGNSPVPVNSPHKGQWRGALMFSLICAWIKDWVNNREAGDLRRHRGHYDVIVMVVTDCTAGSRHDYPRSY